MLLGEGQQGTSESPQLEGMLSGTSTHGGDLGLTEFSVQPHSKDSQLILGKLTVPERPQYCSTANRKGIETAQMLTIHINVESRCHREQKGQIQNYVLAWLHNCRERNYTLVFLGWRHGGGLLGGGWEFI